MQAHSINFRDPIYNNYSRVTPEELLDESVFYKLLITQLKNQDPLSPMKVEDFTAQLAQLTQLEEIRKLNEYMKFISSDLIGKEVMKNDDEVSKRVTGIEIDRNNQKVMLKLEDGSEVDLKDIKTIKESEKEV